MAIYKEDIVDIELTTGTIYRTFLKKSIGEGDKLANRFGIRALRNGAEESLGGSCTGYFIRSTGDTVVIEGTVSGAVAYVDLPQACYAYEGQFALAIKVTSGGATATMRIIDGVVSNTTTGSVVDPGTVIPSVDDLIDAIEAAVASIPADYSSLWTSVAPEFDTSKDYEGGEYVTYDGELYQFGKDHAAGSWSNGDVNEIAAGDGLLNNAKTLEDTEGIKMIPLVFTAGYIDPSTLSIVTTTPGNHLLSNCVYIQPMTLLMVPKISKSLNAVLLAECNSSGTPTAMALRSTITSNSDGSYITFPVVEGGYYRFGGNSTMTKYMRYYAKPFTEDLVFDENNYGLYDSYPSELTYIEGPIVSTGEQGGASYSHTSSIVLAKGMTIEFWAAGSSANVALSKWNNYPAEIISSLIMTNSEIMHAQYTATETMFVRISSRIYAQSDGFSVVLPPEKFHSWKIYHKELHTAKYKESPLYGKKLTVMGDSLIHGNQLGNGATWITNLGIKYNMTYTNLGVNGNTVAEQTEESGTAMVDRISSVPTDTDFFVLLGGANDKRLSVPIGEVDDTGKDTFIGALNNIVSSMRNRCPKAKILFMTTYKRYDNYNTLGFLDKDYAEAMSEVGKRNMIPVFDNFHCSGVNFTDTNQLAWIDESRNRQKLENGQTVYYDPTHHFSVEGYDWLTPIYEAVISSMTATPCENDSNHSQNNFIDNLLEVSEAVDITGNNSFVEPHGKYAEVNGKIYFKIMFKNLKDAASSTGSTTTVASNLPAPSDTPVFYEIGSTQFETGTRMTYESNMWKLYGSRKKDNYTLVYGAYVPAS